MAKSKAHKYFNKFTGWAKHEGMVTVEEPEALNEFFAKPANIPADYQQVIGALFRDWFLLERPLTRCRLTPLALFIKSNEKRFDKTEAAIYRAFLERSRFGIARVAAVEHGEWLDLEPLPRGEICRVIDEMASQSVHKGDILIARLFPFENTWSLSSFVAKMPPEAAYHLARDLEASGDRMADDPVRHRLVLEMFMPPVNWEDEGLDRVRARLASILQRWGVTDITVDDVESDILEAHDKAEMEHPLLKVILNRAPSIDAAREVVPLLQAMWNMTLSGDSSKAGPKERSLLSDLNRIAMAKLTDEDMSDPEAFEMRARLLTREWLAQPQKELGGKCPGDVIRDERRALGNPQKEIGYKMQAIVRSAGVGENRGVLLVNQAIDKLKVGDAVTALSLLKEAYPLVKDHPMAQKILGNLATAYVMAGNREEAIAMLKAALKVDPDYKVARDNLGLLEALTPKEFDRKHKSGFFKKMRIVKDR